MWKIQPTQIERRPRDVTCCVIFLVAVASFAGALYYAYHQGKPQLLLGLKDSSGQACGVDADVKLQPYLFVCPDQLNEFSINAQRVCVDACPASTLAPSYCSKGYASMPTDSMICMPTGESSDMLDKMQRSGMKFVLNFSYFYNCVSHAWPVLLIITPLLTMLVGLCYLRCLEARASLVFWTSAALVILAASVTAVLFLSAHFQPEAAEPTDAEQRWVEGDDLAYGIIAGLVAVLSLVVTWAGRFNLRRSFFFLEAAGECLMDSPAMMAQPCIECLKKALLVNVFALGFFSLLSCRNRIEGPLFGSMLFFMLVIFLWLAESVSTLSHYVMGFLSEEWFFSTYDAYQNRKLMPCSAMGEAYRTGLFLYLGSVGFGAICNVVLKPLRWTLRLVLLVCRCGACEGVRNFYRKMAPFTDSAFLSIALDGHAYLDACNESFRIFDNENVQDSWLHGVLLEVQFIGSCAISCFVTLVTWLLVSVLPVFTDPMSSRYIEERGAVVLAAFLIAHICSWSFMECVGLVAEALLFSYKAGTGGYLGLSTMVSERTALFEMPDCAGGQRGFAPFSHHPPKVTQMMQFLNDGY
ncbi:unnamed protein product [Effrenium voratum]|uniref:Choline transporter-like protein n=1 Tax=Effrenium voratum TaxID=2562239 RepID=A0AA36JGP3_9DINO|nr:unnamed protein product [Effrenium voratum]CAJ1414651.1 unnamed protein product [Effrenium voratum]